MNVERNTHMVGCSVTGYSDRLNVRRQTQTVQLAITHDVYNKFLMAVLSGVSGESEHVVYKILSVHEGTRFGLY